MQWDTILYIVIATTNHPEDLDSALTRPGRFDSHFSVPLPVNASDRNRTILRFVKLYKMGVSKATYNTAPRLHLANYQVWTKF